MKIALLIGHCILHSDENTSSLGYISEYQYIKELTPYISSELNTYGYDCDIITPPEYLLKKPVEELLYKIPRVNITDDNGNYKYDLAIELHLNYSRNPLKHGVRVFYQPGDCFGYRMAERICNYYSKYNFYNLGVNTPPLHLLIQAKITTIVVELYYCTSKIDVKLSKEYGLKKMAEIFVEAINNGPYKSTNDKENVFIRSKHGWVETPDGLSYYNQSIKYINTIENINGDYYFFNSNGVLSVGWKKIRGNIYYFDPNKKGAMVIGDSIYIDRQKYRFDSNGKLVTIIKESDIEYYTDEKSCDITVDGDIIIYPDNLDFTKIMELEQQYPEVPLIKASDYENYNVKYSNRIYYEKEGK